MNCAIHRNKKAGDLLQFHRADDLKLVATTGAQINVVRGPGGTLCRPAKALTKKQRRKLRKQAA